MSLYFEDGYGRTIRLTNERIKHISYHMHLSDKLHLIEETLASPDIINCYGKTAYYQRYLKNENLYFVIVAKISNGEGFIITMFKSRKPKE